MASHDWDFFIWHRASDLLQQAGRILMEDAPFVPLYTLAEIYGLARNILWKGNPDNRVLAAEMKIKS